MDVLVYLIIAFLIFLVCRELVCWYFKTTSIVTLLTEILTQLKIANLKSSAKGGGATKTCPYCKEAIGVNETKCPFCKEEIKKDK